MEKGRVAKLDWSTQGGGTQSLVPVELGRLDALVELHLVARDFFVIPD